MDGNPVQGVLKGAIADEKAGKSCEATSQGFLRGHDGSLTEASKSSVPWVSKMAGALSLFARV
jgi:hypothetical protein